MARALWKGSISFGLVTIPVALYPATKRNELAFHMLDKKDFEPVHLERKNEKNETVPWNDVVKGYEYSDDQWVVLSQADFDRANVEATQTIDIQNFVDEDDIDLVYYDTPYYLEPQKAGRKAYALLRETLKREKKVGVAKVVIRTRQHLAAVKPDGDMLVCEILHWAHEIRDAKELDVPGSDLDKLGVSEQEVKMASQLVDAMIAKWDPEKYRDTYQEDVLKMIEDKVASGQTHAITEAGPEAEERPAAQVVDIMSLLKRSLEQQGKPAEGGGAQRAASSGDGKKDKEPAHAGGGEKKRKRA
jgi:DNA end-binding protein Ku